MISNNLEQASLFDEPPSLNFSTKSSVIEIGVPNSITARDLKW